MTAYALYNEIDDYAADWLENLIRLGHIAPGIVDRRSIEDIRGDDLRGFRQVHFFAGIGVWSYALRRAGISDDTALWTGSCPCQPFSAAGKGDGMDDERHLWPALLHLIRERRPERFFGEQVASKDGLGWLDLVQTDMEAEGYAIGALDTCSAGSGAPHIRQRLRIYAYDLRPAAGALGDPAGTGSLSGPQRGLHHREEGRGPWDGQSERSGDAVWLVDGIEPRLEGFGGGFATEGGHREAALRSVAASGELGRLADDRREHGQRWANSEGPVESDSREWWEDTVHSEPRGSVDRLAHSESCGRADGPQIVGSGGQVFGAAGQIVGIGDRCSFDGLADAGRGQFSQPLRRAEGRDGYGSDRSHPRPGPTNGFWRDADWVFCRDEKWRPIRPGSFPLVDGASFRVDSGSPYAGKSRQGMLKAYGNAIDAEATIDFIDACLEHRTIELEAVADVASGSLSLEDLLA